MPEDALIGFEFFTTDNGLSIANENARRKASEQLVNETAFRNAFDNLDNAVEAVQTAALRKARREDPDWQDNVPPDLTGGDNDFLL